MLGPEEWPSRQQWRTKFGLQVRLLQTCLFSIASMNAFRFATPRNQLRYLTEDVIMALLINSAMTYILALLINSANVDKQDRVLGDRSEQRG